MKIFKSKKLIQKIIISMFLLILVFNLVMPSVVYGVDEIVGNRITAEEFIEKFGDKNDANNGITKFVNDNKNYTYYENGYFRNEIGGDTVANKIVKDNGN